MTRALFVLSMLLPISATAQDYTMHRTNTAGNWRAYISNYGTLFNHQGGGSLAGGLWIGPTTPFDEVDTLIYGAGIWIGGLKPSDSGDVPLVESGYLVNLAATNFRPGSYIYGGLEPDTSALGRDKYRVYRSTDAVGPAWPVRMTNKGPAYIDNIDDREQAGPPYTIGDEDIFTIYTDANPDSANCMGLEIRTQIGFWNKGFARDLMVVRNQIIHPFGWTLSEPSVAVALDGDIQAPNDDRAKSCVDELGRMSIIYSRGDLRDPILGVMLLKGQYGSGRSDKGVTSLRYWNINADPSSDSERYEFISTQRYDKETDSLGDARVAVASLNPKPLMVGDTVYFDYAIFANPSQGREALDPIDSARILRNAFVIRDLYVRNRLWELPVKDQRVVSGLDVFYDPTTYDLTLQSSEPLGTCEIMNALGQVELTKEVGYEKRLKVNTRSWVSGVYFVRSSSESKWKQVTILK